MKGQILGVVLGGLAANLALAATPADTQALEQQAGKLVQAFGGQLKTVLQTAMKSGGPVKALEVCKVNAPQIAKSVGDAEGWTVGRTSLKVRNPNNAPDTWEATVLQNWSRNIAEGAPVAGLKASTIVTIDGKPTYRYMQAIPTGELCVTCHGTHIAKPVKDALAKLYPNDKATGFKVGDLRGAFTLEKVLPE